MALWFLFALMTAAAALAVLWPLGRRGNRPGGSDVAVYRDQIEEIDRDRAAGLIGEREAEAARLEVSRRLLAAADAAAGQLPVDPAASTLRRRAVAVAGLVLLPLGAVALYVTLGAPQLPGQPLAARMQEPPEQRSIQSMLAQVEAHLERNPQDGRGWEVVAPVYMRMGRYELAVKARQNALLYSGESAERQTELGEALYAFANGIVTAEAKRAFDRALALDAGAVKARFFMGLAAEQDGQREEAAGIWRDMLAKAPPDAGWLDFVRTSLARVEGKPAASASAPADAGVGPSQEDMAAASQLTNDQRNEMVRGMVQRLADRLKQNSDDLDGWLRLMRAYMVMGDRDKAREAAASARDALGADAEKVRRVNDVAKSLGLES
jgi:cytochrome c-type biogenesis protein CcmH